MANRIGIDIGGTNLRLGVFANLVLIDELRFRADFSAICKSNTATSAWQEILTITTNAIQSAQNKHLNIQSVGIGFPGFINPQNNILAESPNLPGLKNVNLAADLSQRIRMPVIVENDANAAAFGEYCLAGKPDGGLIYCGLGTGVGGGFVLNGQLYKGVQGMAMEIGHIITEPNGRQCGCGNQGCVEQYASASGIAMSYFNATQILLTANQIAEKARAGDTHAMAAYQLAATNLAMTLAHVLKAINIPNIVIGGGISQAWDLMHTSFNAQLDRNLIPVMRHSINVVRSNANDQAGMLGAAMLGAAI